MLLLLAFLFPLPVYFLVLALIHRRQYPLMVSGSWDFAGVLFAASGFILAGGGYALGSFSGSWRLFWIFGQRHYLSEMESGYYWILLWLFGSYFVLVVAGSALLLVRRSCFTVVYNVAPEAFEELLTEALVSLGLNFTRIGHRFVLTVVDKEAAGKGDSPARTVALDVEPSKAMQTVTLEWAPPAEEGDRQLRQEVERSLEQALTEFPSQSHPISGWLLTVGVLLLAFTFFLMAFLAWLPAGV